MHRTRSLGEQKKKERASMDAGGRKAGGSQHHQRMYGAALGALFVASAAFMVRHSGEVAMEHEIRGHKIIHRSPPPRLYPGADSDPYTDEFREELSSEVDELVHRASAASQQQQHASGGGEIGDLGSWSSAKAARFPDVEAEVARSHLSSAARNLPEPEEEDEEPSPKAPKQHLTPRERREKHQAEVGLTAVAKQVHSGKLPGRGGPKGTGTVRDQARKVVADAKSQVAIHDFAVREGLKESAVPFKDPLRAKHIMHRSQKLVGMLKADSKEAVRAVRTEERAQAHYVVKATVPKGNAAGFTHGKGGGRDHGDHERLEETHRAPRKKKAREDPYAAEGPEEEEGDAARERREAERKEMQEATEEAEEVEIPEGEENGRKGKKRKPKKEEENKQEPEGGGDKEGAVAEEEEEKEEGEGEEPAKQEKSKAGGGGGGVLSALDRLFGGGQDDGEKGGEEEGGAAAAGEGDEGEEGEEVPAARRGAGEVPAPPAKTRPPSAAEASAARLSAHLKSRSAGLDRSGIVTDKVQDFGKDGEKVDVFKGALVMNAHAHPLKSNISVPSQLPMMKEAYSSAVGPKLLGAWPKTDVLRRKRYHTCAVVGNGGIHLAYHDGDAIDAHEAVIRFNAGPTRGFEEHVGARTTIRLVNRQNVEFKEPGREEEVRVQHVTTRQTLHTFLRERKMQPTLYALDPDFYEYVLSKYSAGKTKRLYKGSSTSRTVRAQPTNGYFGIKLALQICDHVTVYGFIRAWRGYVPYHYYDNVTTVVNQQSRDNREFPLLLRLADKHPQALRFAYACVGGCGDGGDAAAPECPNAPEGRCPLHGRCVCDSPFPVPQAGFCGGVFNVVQRAELGQEGPKTPKHHQVPLVPKAFSPCGPGEEEEEETASAASLLQPGGGGGVSGGGDTGEGGEGGDVEGGGGGGGLRGRRLRRAG